MPTPPAAEWISTLWKNAISLVPREPAREGFPYHSFLQISPVNHAVDYCSISDWYTGGFLEAHALWNRPAQSLGDDVASCESTCGEGTNSVSRFESLHLTSYLCNQTSTF